MAGWDQYFSPHRLLKFGAAVFGLSNSTARAQGKQLIVDTDIFSDVDDTAALLLSSTLPNTKLLAVNVNYPSSYSALAASAIVAHYGHPSVPIGLRRPISDTSFFDTRSYELGEYASKVAYHWSGGPLPWGSAQQAWEPVKLYRKVLGEAEDDSITIASIGFLENLSSLLNSTADSYSSLDGHTLAKRKVRELVIMGGGYPSGYEFNFFADNPISTAHVVHSWPGTMTFLGSEVGKNVSTGAILSTQASKDDPVRAAYGWYVGWNTTRFSWDPLTIVYASQGLGTWFEYGNNNGKNFVYPNGSNVWIEDTKVKNQHYLKLKADNETVVEELDQLLLKGADSHTK